MSTQQTGGPSTTRRTLVKGAAWSVPVVAMGSAAPAMAASQYVTFQDLGLACKSPGASCDKAPYFINKGYFIDVRVCTNVRSDVEVVFGEAAVSLNGEPATSGWSITPNPLLIPYDGSNAERCQIVTLAVEGEPNSQNVSITGTVPFSWTSDSGLSETGLTLNFSAPSTPPCPDCGEVPDIQPT